MHTRRNNLSTSPIDSFRMKQGKELIFRQSESLMATMVTRCQVPVRSDSLLNQNKFHDIFKTKSINQGSSSSCLSKLNNQTYADAVARTHFYKAHSIQVGIQSGSGGRIDQNSMRKPSLVWGYIKDQALIERHKRQIAEHYHEKLASATNNDYIRSQSRVAKLLGKNKPNQLIGQPRQNTQQSVNIVVHKSGVYNVDGKSQCSSATTAITMVNYSSVKQSDLTGVTDVRAKENVSTSKLQETQKLLGKRKRDQSELTDNFEEEIRQKNDNQIRNYQTQQDQVCDKLSPGSITEIGELTKNPSAQENKPLLETNICFAQIKNEEVSEANHQNSSKNDVQSKLASEFTRAVSFAQAQDQASVAPVIKRFKQIMLKDKQTGAKQKFRIYMEKDLSFLKQRRNDGKGKLILDFNMSKLEQEYDYDTDDDQLMTAKEMLVQETISAVEFCVKEDPLLLVGNLNES